MFFEGPTIGVNGFSMVFKILRAMVNDGFEVNDCLDVPLQKVRKINLRQSANFEQNMLMNIHRVYMIWTISIDPLHHITVLNSYNTTEKMSQMS